MSGFRRWRPPVCGLNIPGVVPPARMFIDRLIACRRPGGLSSNGGSPEPRASARGYRRSSACGGLSRRCRGLEGALGGYLCSSSNRSTARCYRLSSACGGLSRRCRELEWIVVGLSSSTIAHSHAARDRDGSVVRLRRTFPVLLRVGRDCGGIVLFQVFLCATRACRRRASVSGPMQMECGAKRRTECSVGLASTKNKRARRTAGE